jgi:ankyrin repeat protein
MTGHRSRAVKNDNEAVVELLLEKKANIGSTDKYGRTSLSHAAENGHEVVVKQLLDKNA